ncbi:hypothetical protein MFFC18_12000 [Mariniblastus fucicola]|uniref:AP2 domain protein n=2 Tax=Mariniblastus fucicola TaxID=980251 RepID=A0A5B9P4Z1_9BACT|nr:hypothetical protein MFFC18_12000 [Mariniblastus fucicola]
MLANMVYCYHGSMAKLTNINRGPQGWVVRIVRDGVEHTKYFRFSDGGIRKSQEKALRWRDSQLKKLGERKWHSGPRAKAVNNSSGVTGVSRNVYGRWVATWQEDGRQRFRTFKTKREAIAHRKEQLKEKV